MTMRILGFIMSIMAVFIFGGSFLVFIIGTVIMSLYPKKRG